MSNTVVDVDAIASHTVHPWPYLSSIFEILSVGDKAARVKCLLCQPKQKVLWSALNSPSNLQKHVEVSFPLLRILVQNDKFRNICLVFYPTILTIKLYWYSITINQLYLLQRIHPSELRTYKSLTAGIQSSIKRKSGMSQLCETEQFYHTCKKQLKLGENREMFAANSRNRMISQTDVDRMILEFATDGLLPFRFVSQLQSDNKSYFP